MLVVSVFVSNIQWDLRVGKVDSIKYNVQTYSLKHIVLTITKLPTKNLIRFILRVRQETNIYL